MNQTPIIGKEYYLFRHGKYVGTGTWTNDKWHGICFIASKSDGIRLVYLDIDRWDEKEVAIKLNKQAFDTLYPVKKMYDELMRALVDITIPDIRKNKR